MASSVIYQNPTHHLRCHVEELCAILPAGARLIEEAEVSFIDQRRGLQRVSRMFPPQVMMGQAAQIVVNESDQPVERCPFAVAPVDKQMGEFIERG